MLDLAIPGAAGFASKWSAGEYFKCLVRKKIGTRSVTEIVRPGGVQRERLFQYLARYVVMLSSSSDSVRASLTVPDQHIHTIQLAEPWRSLHEEASHVALTEYDATGVLPNAQATAHALCRAGADAKIAWIFEHLDNEACVIYAHYHETLDAVQAELEAAGITYVRVDGSTTAKERIEARDRFADGTAQVFLGQVVASGIGVDGLQERAIYSISLDHSWRPDVYSQSLARTCRRGQTQETHHFDLVANRLQLHVLNRIRAGEQFNAECQEWQELRTITQDLARNTSPDPTLTPPCPATGQGSTEP
jgi:superfamily II DNA or RNA helicase